MGTDLNNMNQMLLKHEFFAINVLEATYEISINNEVILREVKAALLLDGVTKDYKMLSYWIASLGNLSNIYYKSIL